MELSSSTKSTILVLFIVWVWFSTFTSFIRMIEGECEGSLIYSDFIAPSFFFCPINDDTAGGE